MMLSMDGTADLFCLINFKRGDSTHWFALRFNVFFATLWSTSVKVFGSQWRHNCWCSLNLVLIKSVLSHVVANPSNEKWTDGSMRSDSQSCESSEGRPLDSPEDEAREIAGIASTGLPKNLVGTPIWHPDPHTVALRPGQVLKKAVRAWMSCVWQTPPNHLK